MQESIISFETAKLAKEKGLYELSVNYVYCVGYLTMKASNKLIESIGRKNINNQFHLALAPTQSLLQKWLREKHKLFIVVDILQVSTSNKTGYRFTWTIINLKNTIQTEEDDSPLGFLTYEEALEEGLKQSLSLIK